MYGNAPMERFYNTIENELIYSYHFYTKRALDEVISRYIIVWYTNPPSFV